MLEHRWDMSSGKGYCPSRNDIIGLQLGPVEGHEQDGRRPVIVLSPYEYNVRTGLCIAAPVTRTVRGNPFECAVPQGLPIIGVALSDQTGCRSWTERGARFICQAPASFADNVAAKLKALLP